MSFQIFRQQEDRQGGYPEACGVTVSVGQKLSQATAYVLSECSGKSPDNECLSHTGLDITE